jgi:hypothetical protein
MLTLVYGTFFPLVADAIPWGRASGPAGLAPKPCRSVGAPARVSHKIYRRAGC